MANNIKAIREAKGITQTELANRLGITQASLSNKEAERRPFTVEEVLKLEEILNISVREMFKKVGE